MNLELSPEERAQAAALGHKPEDLVVLTVQVSSEGQPHQPVVVQTPQGALECLMVPYILMIPLATFKKPRGVLAADGKPRSPLLGALPVAHMRLVVPRSSLSADALNAVEGPPPANTDFPDFQDDTMPRSPFRLMLPPEEA